MKIKFTIWQSIKLLIAILFATILLTSCFLTFKTGYDEYKKHQVWDEGNIEMSVEGVCINRDIVSTHNLLTLQNDSVKFIAMVPSDIYMKTCVGDYIYLTTKHRGTLDYEYYQEKTYPIIFVLFDSVLLLLGICTIIYIIADIKMND